MGRLRPKKSDIASPEEILSEDVGRKLVACILDDKHGRFKVLLRGHSKRDIAIYQEPETTLSLLQFASIVGNVQAGKLMLFDLPPLNIKTRRLQAIDHANCVRIDLPEVSGATPWFIAQWYLCL